MTDYIKATNFTTKDSLPTGDTAKIIRGTEFDTEFSNIQTAVNSKTDILDFTALETVVDTKANIASPTFTGNVTLPAYTETVYAITGTTPSISASNGTIQTWTLSGNSTPTETLTSGQSVLLMIDDGSARTITWTMVDVWESGEGLAPGLKTTGYTHILIWKVGSTVYGSVVGDAV